MSLKFQIYFVPHIWGFFFLNYHFLRSKKHEDESKLLSLELQNRSAELGKALRKAENELGRNKNVFWERIASGTRRNDFTGMPKFIFGSSDSLFLWCLLVLAAAKARILMEIILVSS